MRWLFPILAGVLVGLLTIAPSASAGEITTKKAIWGPLERDGVSQFPIYADLGVGIFQMTVGWMEVAPVRPENPRDPSDPAYRWPAAVDTALAEASRHGMRVSLMVLGTPGWANGGRPWPWAPTRPADFADFVEAAAKRWPGVRQWMIWSEPTKAQNFQPLAPDNGRPLRTRRQLRAPRLYARMLDASYSRLKRLSRRNIVIGGNTFTVGTVAPLHWIRALRLPNGRVPRMDMWGHNPFTVRTPDLANKSLSDGYSDFSDLDTLVRVLDRNMRRAPLRKMRRMKIFISEFTLPTDHPNWEFNFFVDRETQADWLTRALKIVRGWSRIYTLGYLALYDDAPSPRGDQVERGLIEHDGDRKPGYEAFKRG